MLFYKQHPNNNRLIFGIAHCVYKEEANRKYIHWSELVRATTKLVQGQDRNQESSHPILYDSSALQKSSRLEGKNCIHYEKQFTRE